MSEGTPMTFLPMGHGTCVCRSGRDYDGSEFGPCEHCEALSLVDRLKPLLLRNLIGYWSDVDEVRQRAEINVGASPAAWRALNGLVEDGLAECSGSDLQYRLTDAGRDAITAGERDV